MPNKRCCRFCKKYDIPRDAPKTKIVCSEDCAIGLTLRDREKKAEQARKARDRQHRKEKQAFRERDKKHQIKETQKVFNQFIRVLDAGKPCISCGRAKCGSRMECGHFLSVGAFPHMRFDPRNAFIQGSGCNSGTEKYRGNDASVRKGYEAGIVERKGQAYLDWLLGPHPAMHYDCDTLIDIRRMFAAEIRFIEKHGRPSRDWRALPAEVRGVAVR